MYDKYRLALLKACKIVGGQMQLAEKIHVDPSRLNKWINRSKRYLPYQCAVDIEKATSGQVTCYELVPEWEKVADHCKQQKYHNDNEYDFDHLEDSINKSENYLD